MDPTETEKEWNLVESSPVEVQLEFLETLGPEDLVGLAKTRSKLYSFIHEHLPEIALQRPDGKKDQKHALCDLAFRGGVLDVQNLGRI